MQESHELPAEDDAADEVAATLDGDKLADVLSKIAPEEKSQIVVYAIGPKGERGRLFRCRADMDADELLDSIGRDYGPGLYEIWGKVGNRIVGRPQVRIGPVSDSIPRLTDRAPTSPSSVSARVITPGDSFALFAQAMENQTKMLERVLSREANREPQSAIDLLKEASALRDILAPPTPPPPTRDAIGMIKDVLALRDLLRENDAPENPLTEGIRTLGPIFSKAMEQLQQRPGAPPGRMARVRAQVRAVQSPEAAAAESPEMFAQMMLRQYVPDLLKRAAAGEPPNVTAEAIAETLGSLPDSVCESVLVWLDADDAAQKIAQLVPAAAPHADWLDTVLDHLFMLFAPDDEPPEGDAKLALVATGANVPRGTTETVASVGAGSTGTFHETPPAGNGAEAVHSVNSGPKRAKRAKAGAGGIPT